MQLSVMSDFLTRMFYCHIKHLLGHHMFVYTMILDSDLYFWSLMGQYAIPTDPSDLTGVIPILRLLNSLEAIVH